MAATPFRKLVLVPTLGLETVLQVPQVLGGLVGKAVLVAVGVLPLGVGVAGEPVVLVPQELKSAKQLLMTKSKREGIFQGFIKALLHFRLPCEARGTEQQNALLYKKKCALHSRMVKENSQAGTGPPHSLERYYDALAKQSRTHDFPSQRGLIHSSSQTWLTVPHIVLHQHLTWQEEERLWNANLFNRHLLNR
jgi:hypothetical protein